MGKNVIDLTNPEAEFLDPEFLITLEVTHFKWPERVYRVKAKNASSARAFVVHQYNGPGITNIKTEQLS